MEFWCLLNVAFNFIERFNVVYRGITYGNGGLYLIARKLVKGCMGVDAARVTRAMGILYCVRQQLDQMRAKSEEQVVCTFQVLLIHRTD